MVAGDAQGDVSEPGADTDNRGEVTASRPVSTPPKQGAGPEAANKTRPAAASAAAAAAASSTAARAAAPPASRTPARPPPARGVGPSAAGAHPSAHRSTHRGPDLFAIVATDSGSQRTWGVSRSPHGPHDQDGGGGTISGTRAVRRRPPTRAFPSHGHAQGIAPPTPTPTEGSTATASGGLAGTAWTRIATSPAAREAWERSSPPRDRQLRPRPPPSPRPRSVALHAGRVFGDPDLSTLSEATTWGAMMESPAKMAASQTRAKQSANQHGDGEREEPSGGHGGGHGGGAGGGMGDVRRRGARRSARRLEELEARTPGDGADEEESPEEQAKREAEREARRVAEANEWWSATVWAEKQAMRPRTTPRTQPATRELPRPPAQRAYVKLPLPVRPSTAPVGAAPAAPGAASAHGASAGASASFRMTPRAVQAHIERLRAVGMGTGRALVTDSQ